MTRKVNDLLNLSVANTRWRQNECVNLIPSEMTPSRMTKLLSILDPVGRYAEHKQIKALEEAEVFYYQGTDFIGEVVSALSVADSALIFVDAVAGVEVGTEIAWTYCDQLDLPRFVVLSKMDRENANFQTAFASAQELTSDATLIPVQLPWGEKQDFKGVIDLFTMKARSGDGKESSDIPEELLSQAEDARVAGCP